MHDTLSYCSKDPIYRKHDHDQLTFSIWYAFTENFVLPLSHDEVVHGKGSLIAKMAGDDWQKFATLRLLYGYMWAHPGKKLLFMGGELAQRREWDHETSLDWHLLEHEPHRGMTRWVQDLNRFYREHRALAAFDFEQRGFEWVDHRDAEASVIGFLRKGEDADPPVLVVCNFTPVPRPSYRLGVPREGFWREALNSDAPLYGGSGQGNLGGVESAPVPAHGHYHSIVLTLPPLAVIYWVPEPGSG
jgi:1,4-alpha-glucan branching enzyme